MTVRLKKYAFKNYWYLPAIKAEFKVTSKNRWNYFVAWGGIDNLYMLSKSDCEIVKQ